MTRFNPLGYHTGSVWPHDTAMAIEGLYATGQSARASSYVDGLIRAAEAFDYRLPELYGGRGRAGGVDADAVPAVVPSAGLGGRLGDRGGGRGTGDRTGRPGRHTRPEPGRVDALGVPEVSGLRLGDDVCRSSGTAGN